MGTELQARMAPNIKITSLFPLHLIFWTSNQPRRISISRGPGLCVSSETSLLATHQNTSWAFHRARSQDCRFRFMDVFCLWLVLLLLEFFLSFFWKGLVVFIYCKQVGRAYKSSFVQQALVSRRRAALFEYLTCVRDLLFVCCQDASGYQPPLLIKRLFFYYFSRCSPPAVSAAVILEDVPKGRGIMQGQRNNLTLWLQILFPEVIFL